MAKADSARAQLLMNKAEQELWVFSGLMQLSIPAAGTRNSKVLHYTATATTTATAVFSKQQRSLYCAIAQCTNHSVLRQQSLPLLVSSGA
jgi:hypothetical protein